jgi:hypothetical protein
MIPVCARRSSRPYSQTPEPHIPPFSGLGVDDLLSRGHSGLIELGILKSILETTSIPRDRSNKIRPSPAMLNLFDGIDSPLVPERANRPPKLQKLAHQGQQTPGARSPRPKVVKPVVPVGDALSFVSDIMSGEVQDRGRASLPSPV